MLQLIESIKVTYRSQDKLLETAEHPVEGSAEDIFLNDKNK